MAKILLLCLLLLLSGHAETEPKEISFKTAKRIHTAGSGLFIDARGIKFYKQGTILGAIAMPIERFARMKRFLPGKKSSKLVIFCNGIQCQKSTKLAKKIAALGYSRVMVYRGGYPEWRERGQEVMLSEKYCQASDKPKQEAVIKGVKIYLSRDEGMIDPAWFMAQYRNNTLPEGIALIDVRSKEAFERGHLTGAIHLPWDSEKGKIDSGRFPKDKLILLYCNTGLLSSDAYDSLDKETARRVRFLKAIVRCKKGKCTIE